MSLVYLNGAYRPLAEAAVNVLDRGFTFGDGVYEVIPVYNRRVFCGAAHLTRLDNSLRAIHMANPLSRADWAAVFARLIEALAESEQSIYLQITRGPAEREHAMPRQTRPTVFAMSRPLARPDMAQGIHAITHEDIRWQCCDIKAITLLASVLLRRRAEERGAREAILLRDDTLTEGAASNVFICNKGVISTPEQDRHVLPGITRGVLIDLLRENALACRERPIQRAELCQADEIWLTSSTWEIAPVVQLDNAPVGAGKPGPLWARVNALYQDFKRQSVGLMRQTDV